MARRRARDLTVGVMFALALVIVAAAVMTVGAESALFRERAFFYATFPTTTGLGVGSPVEMAGVQIGTVTRIHLPTDPTRKGIEVQLGIDAEYAPRIREDSRALLRVRLYLTGEKGVEITPGDANLAPLPEGSTIALGQSVELFEQVGEASENLTEITVSLRNVLSALERGDGLLGQMINDPEFGKQGLDAMRGTLENLQALTSDVRRGRGVVGRLLYDEEFAGHVDELGDAIGRVSALLERVATEGGAIEALTAEGGSGQQAIEDLRDASASLKRLAANLEEGRGLLGRLLSDEEYSERLADDLAQTLHNAAEITGKINRGEGTLGALVNERTLHDGLEDIAAGVNDSKFARWMMRHYQKKGIESQSEAENDDE